MLDAESQKQEAYSVSTLDRVREKYATIRTSSARGELIVEKIVGEYANDLDAYVAKIEDQHDRHQEFSDIDLAAICFKLPILIYRLGTGVSRAALEVDVAKATIASIRAQRYIEAPGKTIPEKTAYAEIAAMDEATIVDLARHVHSRIKHRIEVAQLLFDGIRKVMTQREKDKEAFRGDTRRT